MTLTINLALLLVFGVWVLRTIIQALRDPFRKIPGPWYTRFTRLPLLVATLKGRRVFFVHALHQKYGDVVRIAPYQADTTNPDMFREIHRHGNGFEKAAWYQSFANFSDAEENHPMFTMSNSKIHSARRKLMARAFSKTEIRKHWEHEIKQKVDLAVDRMGVDARANPKGEIDCEKWWLMMAGDVSSRITFGESFDMLKAGAPEPPQEDQYLESIARNAEANTLLAEVPALGFVRRLHIPVIQLLFNITGKVLELAALTVEKSRRKGTAGARNIFTGVLAEAEKSGSKLSDLVLSREAGSLIIAGTDTTAITLTFIIWCVLSRPQLREALVAELRQQEQIENGFSDGNLEKLLILNGVIQETMRLYGSVPGSLPRKPPRGGASVRGLYVPEGAVISTQAWSTHRNPRVWKNPEEFDISRWDPVTGMSEDAKLLFNPFGAGTRICLGLHIAWIELRYATAMFFLRYPKASLAPETSPESLQLKQYFIMNTESHQCKITL